MKTTEKAICDYKLTHVSTGYCPGCEECEGMAIDDGSGGKFVEAWFCKWPCELCGSELGGDRHPMHGRDIYSDILHLNVCTDCLLAIDG